MTTANPSPDLRSFGYAPGWYICRCLTCKKEFFGDKRSITCQRCAEKRMSEVDQQPQEIGGANANTDVESPAHAGGSKRAARDGEPVCPALPTSKDQTGAERAFFECWAKTQEYDLTWSIDGEDDPGAYLHVSTRIAWRAWQGRASMPTLSECTPTHETPRYQPPQLTDTQLQKFAREHITHGLVYVVYEAGEATVLSFEDVRLDSSVETPDSREVLALRWLAESADPDKLTGWFAVDHARRALGLPPLERPSAETSDRHPTTTEVVEAFHRAYSRETSPEPWSQLIDDFVEEQKSSTKASDGLEVGPPECLVKGCDSPRAKGDIAFCASHREFHTALNSLTQNGIPEHG